MFWLQSMYKSDIFKPKNRLKTEPGSTLDYTGFFEDLLIRNTNIFGSNFLFANLYECWPL